MHQRELYKKLRILVLIFVFIFFIFALRLLQLQVFQGERYRELSEGNRIAYRPIPASRGRILVRDGDSHVITVSNKMAYTVSLIPANIDNIILNDIIQSLGDILDLKAEEIMVKIQESSRLTPICLKRKLSSAELIALEEMYSDLPGLVIDRMPIREYLFDDMCAHTLGYVGEISRTELNTYFHAGYRIGDLLGKTGLEKFYESSLRGVDGIRQIEVNSLGKEVGTLGIKPPVQGSDLYLNISKPLQLTAEYFLEHKIKELQALAVHDKNAKGGPTGGSIIAMEPNTGKILAMASYPSYDLNLFAGGIGANQLTLLQNDPLQPFLDRTIQTALPPGSVFKIIVGLAALENLGINPYESLFSCPGDFNIGQYRWRCWKDTGHGNLNFLDAFANSCNVAFYTLGQSLHQKGGEIIQRTAREFGLGRLTGIDMPTEQAGLLPDASWKKEKIKEPWYIGDTINLSVGQGSLLVTPLQLVNMACAIANGGHLMQPYLLEKIVSANGEVLRENKPRILNEIDISKDSLNNIKKSMEAVVKSGTGRSLSNFPIGVAGKTGTAQTVTTLERANHGWFVGYAPIEKPEIAFIVFLEHGNDSSNAIPIARELLEVYFGYKEVKCR